MTIPPSYRIGCVNTHFSLRIRPKRQLLLSTGEIKQKRDLVSVAFRAVRKNMGAGPTFVEPDPICLLPGVSGAIPVCCGRPGKTAKTRTV